LQIFAGTGMDTSLALTPEIFNKIGADKLPGHMGIVVVEMGEGRLLAAFEVQKHHLAPNGYLHAGSVVSLADTATGYACAAHLPEGATGFTTIELKSNFLGTALQGSVQCLATAVHLGKTTQIWDGVVSHRESGKIIAMFRCTQMILFPKR